MCNKLLENAAAAILPRSKISQKWLGLRKKSKDIRFVV